MDSIWLGFDVDETLGNFQYLFPIFELLMLQDSTYEAGQHTFQYLTQYIANNESSPEGRVGLFRPGLYNFFAEKLKPLRDAGALKGMVMYSNNSEYDILRFCAVVIDRWIGSSGPSFCNLIHRNHRIRQNTYGQVPSLEKNWSILTKAFLDGKCPSPVLGQTFFYDDLDTHRNLMERLGSNYIQVVPFYGPVNIGKLLISLRDSLVASGILKKKHVLSNMSETGSDYVFDADYIARLHNLYTTKTTPDFIKKDLQQLFLLTGETPEQLANVTWKNYQKALQLLFQKEDISILKYKRQNTRPTSVNMKQWYDPLVTPAPDHESANAKINRRMRELDHRFGKQTHTANRSRSSSIGLVRSNTAKKAPGRSLANMATNYNNAPKSMENEFKAAFGLGGGRRTRRSYTRKNASRKKKSTSRR